MKPQLLDILLCPARDCLAPDLTLEAQELDTIQYKEGAVEEVKEGTILCRACGRKYPVTEYVPIFEQLFPDDLKSEADFWGGWYGFMWDKGHLGYFDMREPAAPFLTSGVGISDPARALRNDLPGVQLFLEEHPLIHPAKYILEIGCGTGWNSLYFARHGHSIVAFDPAARSVRLAKRYAIAQGEYMEYICAAQGAIAFKPEVFDAVLAFHSLHHIPRLRDELGVVRSWLKDGGGIAVDEHVRDDPILQTMKWALIEWAEAELFPAYRDGSLDDLQGLPTASHSELEGAGSEDVIGAVLDNFELVSFSSRFYALDILSFLQFLTSDLALPAYYRTSHAVDRLYEKLASAFPDRVELVTLIATKSDGAAGSADAGIDQARDGLVRKALVAAGLASGQPKHAEILQGHIERLHEVIEAKNRQIADLEDWARGLEGALARERRLLKRITNGRVMRLLTLLRMQTKQGGKG
ncbi:MAG: methyltransferase domain-containing protein [Chloroflexia bacterium]